MQNSFQFITPKCALRSQAILGLAEAAQNNPAFEEDKEGFMHVIYRNARRLDKLIKNIQDVTRIEGHTLQLDKQRFSLNDLLFSVIKETQTQILANNSKIKLSLLLDNHHQHQRQLSKSMMILFL